MANLDFNDNVATDLSGQIVSLSLSYRALMNGYRWGPAGDLDGTAISYSFPGENQNTAWFAPDYSSERNNWTKLDAGERTAVRSALDIFKESANLTFYEVDEFPNSNQNMGDLRFAISANVSSYAHAYSPWVHSSAGDVWFSHDWYYDHDGSPFGEPTDPVVGQYDFLTILHEVGHALGLKHPFQGVDRLPDAKDSIMFTVMSYDLTPGLLNTSGYANRYPTTLMTYDIQALEWLYGKSTTANLGGTTHSYSAYGAYWETITDSGGRDTLSYTGFGTSTRISLIPGDYSTLGTVISFSNGATDNRTVWIGPSTIIENASSSVGNNEMIGNHVGNQLFTSGGNDTLRGNAGADTLGGGDGSDQLFGGDGDDRINPGRGSDKMSGGQGLDRFIFDGGPLDPIHGHDTISGFVPADDSIYLWKTIYTAFSSNGKITNAQYREAGNVDAVGATTTSQRILYDTDSGKLYYDSNGSAAGGKILIAVLSGDPNIGPADIIVF